MKKNYCNRAFREYSLPKINRGVFVLLASLILLLPMNSANAGPWPIFNIKDYEDAAANWASKCFPEESVRRASYGGCPGNKVGHHAVTVYLTGGYIMRFDIRDERISDDVVEAVVDSVVCKKGGKEIDCPCYGVLSEAKEIKNKENVEQYKNKQKRKK